MTQAQKKCCHKIIDGQNYSMEMSQVFENYVSNRINQYGYIHGKEYKSSQFPGNSAQLLENKGGEGTVFYNGIEYKGLILYYDILNDALINVPNHSSIGIQYLELNNERVDSFHIKFNTKHYKMEYIDMESTGVAISDNGYFEVPYANKMKLLIKHVVINDTENERSTYSHARKFYLIYNNRFHVIKTRRQFLNLFPDQTISKLKKRIKSYKAAYKNLSNYHLIDLIVYAETIEQN